MPNSILLWTGFTGIQPIQIFKLKIELDEILWIPKIIIVLNKKYFLNYHNFIKEYNFPFIRYNRCSIIGSINIPFSNVLYGESKIENIGQHHVLIKNNKEKIIVVVGNEETDLELVIWTKLFGNRF